MLDQSLTLQGEELKPTTDMGTPSSCRHNRICRSEHDQNEEAKELLRLLDCRQRRTDGSKEKNATTRPTEEEEEEEGARLLFAF